MLSKSVSEMMQQLAHTQQQLSTELSLRKRSVLAVFLFVELSNTSTIPIRIHFHCLFVCIDFEMRNQLFT